MFIPLRRRIIETYSKEYSLFKPDKKLRWLPQLGSVDLSIELKDRTVEVKVPPLEAAIIELYSQKGQYQDCQFPPDC
jgi:anaphase-promoting complex subunit 2